MKLMTDNLMGDLLTILYPGENLLVDGGFRLEVTPSRFIAKRDYFELQQFNNVTRENIHITINYDKHLRVKIADLQKKIENISSGLAMINHTATSIKSPRLNRVNRLSVIQSKLNDEACKLTAFDFRELMNYTDLHPHFNYVVECSTSELIALRKFVDEYVLSYRAKVLEGQEALSQAAFYATKLWQVISSPDFIRTQGVTNASIFENSQDYFYHSMLFLRLQGYIQIKSVKMTWSINGHNKHLGRCAVVFDSLKVVKTAHSSGYPIRVVITSQNKKTIYTFPFGNPLEFTTDAHDHCLFDQLLAKKGEMLPNAENKLDANQFKSARTQLQSKIDSAKLSSRIHVFSKREGSYYLVITPPNYDVEIVSH